MFSLKLQISRKTLSVAILASLLSFLSFNAFAGDPDLDKHEAAAAATEHKKEGFDAGK